MDEEVVIKNERVDDIPLLLAQMERMGIQPLLDSYFPTHGNWKGLTLGWVSTIWLAHILSLGDHRLNRVQSWAEKRLETLKCCTDQAVRALDFADDRLESVLDALSDDLRSQEFEAALNQRLIRVYDLINCCNHLSCGQKRFPLFELIFALEFKPQDLILEPWYFQV